MYEYVLFLHMHIKSAMTNAAGKLLLWLNMLNKSDMRIVNFWFSAKQPSVFVLLMIYNTKVYLLLKKRRSSKYVQNVRFFLPYICHSHKYFVQMVYHLE